MFARPATKKDERKKQEVKKPIKRTLFSSTKINIHRPNEPIMTKMTSIRTLPPFAYMNSESGNSQKHSEGNSEIWKEEEELFETAIRKDSQSIDQQLEDVLETIRIQRKVIDLKIMKLKTKLQQITLKNSRGKIKQADLSHDQSVSTQPLYSNACMSNKVESEQKQVQTENKRQSSLYYQQVMRTLQLDNWEGSKQCEPYELNDDMKIKQNKQILRALLDLV